MYNYFIRDQQVSLGFYHAYLKLLKAIGYKLDLQQLRIVWGAHWKEEERWILEIRLKEHRATC